MFGWVIVSRQLHFHIYYLFVEEKSLRLRTLKVNNIDQYSAEREIICVLGNAHQTKHPINIAS
jgi:hypothetical protein